MKNAHERFGALLYRRRTEKTATNIRVSLDAFVGEEGGKAHFVSVVGGDVEIGALAAAFANGDSFSVMDPYGIESIVSLVLDAIDAASGQASDESAVQTQESLDKPHEFIN